MSNIFGIEGHGKAFHVTDDMLRDAGVTRSPLQFPRKGRGVNGFVFGTAGKGKGIHPWDGLNPCRKCGHMPLLLGKDGLTFEGGGPYFVHCRCGDCGQRTDAFPDWADAVARWNALNGGEHEEKRCSVV